MSEKTQRAKLESGSKFGVRGEAFIRLYRREPTGAMEVLGHRVVLEKVQRIRNLIVDTGLDWIADRLSAVPVLAVLSHIELGTDGTPPAAGDLALGGAIAGSRLALATGPTQSGATLTYTGFWDLGVATNAAIAEAGDFNAPAAGTMIGRIVFGPFDKTDEHILSIERIWTFTRG